VGNFDGHESRSDLQRLAVSTLHEQGWSLLQLAEAFSLEPNDVQVILDPAATGVGTTAHAQSAGALSHWLKTHPGSSARDAQAALGLSDAQLSAGMTDEVRRLAIRAREGEYSQVYSDEDVFAALRRAWDLAKSNSVALSYDKYRELVGSGQIDGPSAPRILQRFGTWIAAAGLAGVPTGTRPNRTYESAWTDEEILKHVANYLDDPTTSGSFAGWDVWKKVNAPSAPSGPTLRNRIGSWSQIKRRALEMRP
jgi:hypothetical protein